MSVLDTIRARAREFLAPAETPPAAPRVEQQISQGRFLADPAQRIIGLIGKRLSNTDSVLRKRGSADLKLWADLFEDERVFTSFQQRQLSVIAREWTVDPGADDAPSKAAADHLRAQLDNIRFDDVSTKMLFGRWYGYAVAEPIWAVGDDGLIAIERIDVPDRAWFGFNSERALVIIDPLGIADTPVPERKFWSISSGADNDFQPYGVGLAHWCYWPVFFKRGGLPQWLRFLERFASPAVIGKAGPGMLEDAGMRQKVMDALRAVYGNNQAAVPAGLEVQLLQAAGDGAAGFERLIAYCDQAITRVILGQTMTTEDGSSRSQAEVHMDVRAEIVRSDADLLCESFNRGPAVWLTEWNFPGATPPRVYRVMDDPEDINDIATRDTALDALGWQRTDESFADVYGEGYERKPKVAPPPMLPRREPDDASPQFSAQQLDAIDRIVAGLGEAGREGVMAMVDGLGDKLADVHDEQTLRIVLLDHLERMPTDAFAAALAKVNVAVRAASEAGVGLGRLAPAGDLTFAAKRRRESGDELRIPKGGAHGGEWTKDEIASLIQAHATRALGTKEKSVTDLGPVSPENIEIVRSKAAFDLTGYRRSISSDSIRHAMKSHGDPAREGARTPPQVAIRKADYALIPDIVEQAHTVKLVGEPHSHDPQRLEYRATIAGRDHHYVETIHPDKTVVALKTMMKR